MRVNSFDVKVNFNSPMQLVRNYPPCNDIIILPSSRLYIALILIRSPGNHGTLLPSSPPPSLFHVDGRSRLRADSCTIPIPASKLISLTVILVIFNLIARSIDFLESFERISPVGR